MLTGASLTVGWAGLVFDESILLSLLGLAWFCLDAVLVQLDSRQPA